MVPGDFNHDGILDVLIMSGPSNKDELSLTGITNAIFLGNGRTLNPSGWTLPNSHGQLTPFDYRGIMQVDLLGVLSKGPGKLEVLTSNAASADDITTNLKRTEFEPAMECGTSGPQWHAFADVNGDGRPDIVLTCHTGSGVDVHVLYAGEHGYSAGWKASFPKSASQFAIVDVDADGSPDLVYTVCESSDSCELHILYNGQRPFCSGSSKDSKQCRGNSVHFGHVDASAGFQLDGNRHQVIPLTEILKGRHLMRQDPITGIPVPLAFGDYDLDGHPDLLVTVSDKPGKVEDSRAVLLRNLDCSGNRLGCRDKSGFARRTFLEGFENVEALGRERGIVQAAFADVRGKGGLAIIGNGYSGDTPKLVTFANDAFNDAFFVRAECLNGVCPAPCSRKATGSKAADPYGVNYSGAAFRLSFTDIDGTVRVRSASQLSQTGNRALQMPFAIFGLGRTNSFVDIFSAGVSARLPGSPPTHSQTHIVPNSDLIVIPPHADSPTDWSFQIHIHPAAHFMWVAVALATALTILASLTAFFKIKERREDEVEKRKRAHAINFDAM